MEQELITGVYRLYDPKDGASYVGFSRNLRGTQKRLRFELNLNMCTYKPLQALWNARGGLEFETLETYQPGDMDDLALDAYLKGRVADWMERLGADTRCIQGASY